MSPVAHDHLLEVFKDIQQQLEQKDAVAAELATAKLLALLRTTADPAADPRLVPIFLYCQKLAHALKASMEEQLQSLATSQRAAHAYEREL